MKTIPLNQGKVAIVDDADFEHLSQFKWRMLNGRYAHRHGKKGEPSSVLMHAYLAGTPKGFHTDHIDGNGLNNQRSNLRVCTCAQNASNRGIAKHNTTGLKCVRHCPRNKSNPWVAYITKGRKHIHIGYFKSREDAARAYDATAIRINGQFARTNLKGQTA